jgi:DNA-binding NarL/FixJ family response regulator
VNNGALSPPARLLIVDDHDLVREGTRVMLARETDLKVVGEAENGREALKLCRELSPDLVLMDVRMPEMDGLEATRRIKEEHPTTSVLILTSHESPEHLSDAIRAGAAGYVLKDATRQQLLNAVRRVLEGESPLNQELAMRLLRRLTEEKPTGARSRFLSSPATTGQNHSPSRRQNHLRPGRSRCCGRSPGARLTGRSLKRYRSASPLSRPTCGASWASSGSPTALRRPCAPSSSACSPN